MDKYVYEIIMFSMFNRLDSKNVFLVSNTRPILCTAGIEYDNQFSFTKFNNVTC